ncbi:hypothetical protein [Janthinobacterium fluminis]|uniref:Uncharacterized protein n=1 Tax=Janthinobacterium fluminis TaxID=2987524 RepID=A0ABT5K742_9BURK|nr:hypothetical protein [Janthinobacterium fluminis]MDC8760729.1 hypothetical protein [Janthinobacterium fluminis]
MAIIKDEYTRKVSGESFEYELDYSTGTDVAWIARVYRDGELKGSPHGALTGNVLAGVALQQYLIGYVEGMIERGLDVAE